jgi:hypothetical protein
MALFCNFVLSVAKFLLLADFTRFLVRNPRSHQHQTAGGNTRWPHQGTLLPVQLPNVGVNGSTTADGDLIVNFCRARQNTGKCHLLPYRARILCLARVMRK